jgi:hypothetical protein
VGTLPLTVTQAAQLIRQYHRNARHPVAPPAPGKPTASPGHEVAHAPEHGPAGGRHGISENARMHSYRLRIAVESARLAVAQNPEGPNVKADFHSTTTMRRNFWRDTCCDVREMQVSSMEVLELHQNFGARFFTPTVEEVQGLLDALDAAMSAWDKEHPELFYQALRLNFPKLVRPA